MVFDSRVVPDDWLLEIIQLIYKGKGNSCQPETYRPLTHLINEAQTGFRKCYCTTYNIFAFDFIFKYALNNKNIYKGMKSKVHISQHLLGFF